MKVRNVAELSQSRSTTLFNASHKNQLSQPISFLNLIGCFIGNEKMRMQKNILGTICLLISSVA